MSNNLANVHAFGGNQSAFYVADLGVTFPTGLAIPGAEFADAGWLGEDGVSVERSTSDNTLKAHQGGRVIKRRVTNDGEVLKVQMLEQNAVSYGLTYPNATLTTTGGITTIVPSGEASKTIAAISDEFSGDIQVRHCITRGEVNLAGEIVFKNDEWTVLEFEVFLEDFYIVTDNEALVVS